MVVWILGVGLYLVAGFGWFGFGLGFLGLGGFGVSRFDILCGLRLCLVGLLGVCICLGFANLLAFCGLLQHRFGLWLAYGCQVWIAALRVFSCVWGLVLVLDWLRGAVGLATGCVAGAVGFPFLGVDVRY